MNDLPKQFESFNEARRNGFLAAKKIKDDGKKMVGVFCCFTPTELILAAGAVPVGVCGVSEEPIKDAEKVLPRNLCPLIKSSYGHVITDTCPYFYFSDLLVGETTCDGKKKMYEELSKIKPMHVMQLPNRATGKNEFNLWKDEVILLKEVLEKELGVNITEEEIKAAIKDKNEERALLNEYFELAKSEPSALTSLELYQVSYQVQFKFDRDELKASLRKIIDDTKARYERGECPVKKNAPRILITGSPIGGCVNKIVKTLEEAGASVVAYELCSSIRSNKELIDEENPDIYEAIAKRYLNIGCACMMNNQKRIDLLDELIDEYKVDGVIDIALQSCHPFNVESYKIKEFVTGQKNIDYMAIETDYSETDTEQLRTRFEAFIEMIEDKK
ncbi:MAG: double-cubane-cluster-containing anaerobic reductase [Intestinibacter sp.]|uniref:double-cubane-cluster-containing anaerobic reductase n=1 Tax=Intestinibacter sp. TaxID=1965304 RepID=UPI003F16F47E